jgi:hypothetical protein
MRFIDIPEAGQKPAVNAAKRAVRFSPMESISGLSYDNKSSEILVRVSPVGPANLGPVDDMLGEITNERDDISATGGSEIRTVSYETTLWLPGSDDERSLSIPVITTGWRKATRYHVEARDALSQAKGWVHRVIAVYLWEEGWRPRGWRGE